MATTPPVPAPPAPAGPPAGAGPALQNPAFAVIARIAQEAQMMAKALPETSPMAEEIQNQARLALQKAIQGQAPTQQTPPI
jgi:hypothetical protein